MRHTALTFVVAAVAGALALPAQADSVAFSGFFNGSETVNVTLSSPNAGLSEAVSAGGFATSLNGGPSFETFCVDLYQTIGFGDAPYTDYTPPGTSHAFTNSRAYADLGRLYATAGPLTGAVSEAAFQIAVWEIAYETSANAYDLTSGAAIFGGGTADTSGALSLASNWLSHLTTGPFPAIKTIDSPTRQDVIYAPVPEPETYALFLAGLGAVGYISRRRRA